jgi:hypothetical protein
MFEVREGGKVVNIVATASELREQLWSGHRLKVARRTGAVELQEFRMM